MPTNVAPRRRPRRPKAQVVRISPRGPIDLMITRGIREFVSRDWRAVREAKDAYWAARVQRLGASEAFRIADELRRQAVASNPRWPRPGDRDDDLRSHVRVSDLMRRADAARRR